MAHYHVHADPITRASRGGASGFSAYLDRTDVAADATRKFSRYLDRENAGADLVAQGHGHLPQWAHDAPAAFWQGVDTYEYKNALLARHYQISLPRELSTQGRLDLAHDLVDTFFAQYPHQWDVHCPVASDGQDNPHVHVLFSTRRDHLDHPLNVQTWFKKGGDGIRKDPFWDTKAALQGVRHESAVLINAALEREGVSKAVSADRLKGQGHGRNGVHYGAFATEQHKAQKQYMQVALRHRGIQEKEQAANVEPWQQQRKQEALYDLSREAMVDRVRNRFWRQDRSPVREQERVQSIERFIAREHQRTGRPPQGPRSPRQHREAHSRGPSVEQQMQAQMARMRQLEREGEYSGGLRVRLHDEDEERARKRDHGMSW